MEADQEEEQPDYMLTCDVFDGGVTSEADGGCRVPWSVGCCGFCQCFCCVSPSKGILSLVFCFFYCHFLVKFMPFDTLV